MSIMWLVEFLSGAIGLLIGVGAVALGYGAHVLWERLRK